MYHTICCNVIAWFTQFNLTNLELVLFYWKAFDVLNVYSVTVRESSTPWFRISKMRTKKRSSAPILKGSFAPWRPGSLKHLNPRTDRHCVYWWMSIIINNLCMQIMNLIIFLNKQCIGYKKEVHSKYFICVLAISKKYPVVNLIQWKVWNICRMNVLQKYLAHFLIFSTLSTIVE